MEQYISETDFPDGDQYGITTAEAFALCDLVDQSRFDAILLAFRYGRAKGIRAHPSGWDLQQWLQQ